MDLYFKTALVFAHFGLAAFCLVTVLATDLKVLKNYARPLSVALCEDIARAKHAVPRALLGLWISGLLIVAHGVATQPYYLSNDKLWFKLVVVVALSVNGLLVHRVGRVVQPGAILATLDERTALHLNLAGATSSTSWLWACFLGTARAWNGTLSFSTILLYYLTSLAFAMSVAVCIHLRRRRAFRAAIAD